MATAFYNRGWEQRAGRMDIGYGGIERTYRSSGPRDKMVARNDWPCKFAGCGDRTVVAGKTVIVKRDGRWGHEACPKATTWATAPAAAARIQAEQDDREMAELEMAADRAEAVRAAQAEIARDAALSQVATAISCGEHAEVTEALVGFEQAEVEIADAADALLAEYEAAQQSRRAANLKNLQVGTYRVEFSGRRNTEPLNLKVTKDKVDGAFRFKKKESWEGAGRVFADGRIQLWTNTNLTREEQERVREALEILLAADRLGKYGEAYARESGACFRCGRTLTDEDSIDRGLGSHCATMVEVGY